MQLNDYPALFREYDKLAIESQQKHTLLVRVKVLFIVLAGIVPSIAWYQNDTLRLLGSILLAIFLILSISITAIIKETKNDEVWFESRAVAEKIKTESWLFMVRAEPYTNLLSEDQAEKKLMQKLREILHNSHLIGSKLSLTIEEPFQITDRMRKIRVLDQQELLDFYSKYRLADQALWYANKAKFNRQKESSWFVLTWILEIAAVVLAIAMFMVSETYVNPVEIITTVSVGVLSWTNSKSYKEAAQSYGLIAEELFLIKEDFATVKKIEDANRMIGEVEELINQEHRIWLGRLF
jgi:hypothetical protein